MAKKSYCTIFKAPEAQKYLIATKAATPLAVSVGTFANWHSCGNKKIQAMSNCSFNAGGGWACQRRCPVKPAVQAAKDDLSNNREDEPSTDLFDAPISATIKNNRLIVVHLSPLAEAMLHA